MVQQNCNALQAARGVTRQSPVTECNVRILFHDCTRGEFFRSFLQTNSTDKPMRGARSPACLPRWSARARTASVLSLTHRVFTVSFF